MSVLKKNINEFNDDVKANAGYLYTTHQALSSVLANKRICESTDPFMDEFTTLVDIGCGDGVYTSELKARFPILDIEGIDPAEKAIASAQVKYPHITFRAMSILQENITQTIRKFDAALFRGVLHHLSDPQLAIQNALTIAETVIIVEPNGNNPLLKIIEKLSPYHRKHEEQSFTSRQLESWCIQAGGVVVHKEYLGFIPFFFPELPTRIIYIFQPTIERLPLIRVFFSAQIMLVCKRASLTAKQP